MQLIVLHDAPTQDFSLRRWGREKADADIIYLSGNMAALESGFSESDSPELLGSSGATSMELPCPGQHAMSALSGGSIGFWLFSG